MSPPSQYQARRLLELVSYNKARVSNKEHIDHDVWARTDPPVRGLNFRDRATARCCLRAGGLGAVPSTPPQLPDVESRALPPVPSNHHNEQSIPRVESDQSKLTVSSVPSFGKMREPLSGDSVTLNAQPTRPAPVTEYEEFGSEALITQVQDEIDEEFDDSTPSRLFSEIGPSVSVAKGIDGKKRKQSTELTLEHLEVGIPDPLVEAVSQSRDDTESEEKSLSSASKSLTSATKTTTSMPSTSTTLPPAPLPAYALEPGTELGNYTHVIHRTDGVSVRPPPPPPLYAVQSYGSTSAVPPPPSSPPPEGEDKRARRDTEDSSPVTEGESYGYRGYVRDEYSEYANSSLPSMKAHWYREYAPAQRLANENVEEEVHEDADEEEDSFGAEEVDSIEEEEYEREVEVTVERNMVGRRREALVG